MAWSTEKHLLEEINRTLNRVAGQQEHIIHLLDVIVEGLFPPEPQATTATTTFVQGDPMGTATTAFQDASGNPQPPPNGDGSGVTVTYSASPDGVITFAAATASGDTASATGTRSTNDAFTLSTVVANTSGAPLLDDDGVTAFIQPADVSVPAVVPPEQATTGVTTFTES